jgi:hypothetical protein
MFSFAIVDVMIVVLAMTSELSARPRAPAAPSALGVTAQSSSLVTLQWVDNSSNESGFRIERSTGCTETFVQVATVGSNVYTFGDPGLSENTCYSYRARAYNGSGNSNFTNAASATTLANSSPPPTADRDWRLWPFSSTSPWNYPIGNGARYASVSLTSITASISFKQWTSSVVIASSSDPVTNVRYGSWGGSTPSTWTYLHNGGDGCFVSPSTLDPKTFQPVSTIKNYAFGQSALPPFLANYYSTINSPSTTRVWPASLHASQLDYYTSINMPTGACGSPDSDGMMSVIQPTGWALDTYATVTLDDQTLLASMGSFVDLKGDGTGYWNGRRASMIPSLAGLIRKGELASGRIPHALAVTISPTVLKEQAIWPASAFDMNSGYSGALPMGSLLGIPPWVNIDGLGLTPLGKVIARAAQNYGIFIVDRTGGPGINILSELGNPDIGTAAVGATGSYPNTAWIKSDVDLQIIKNNLQLITNNTPITPGGGGAPRQPLAPDLR